MINIIVVIGTAFSVLKKTRRWLGELNSPGHFHFITRMFFRQDFFLFVHGNAGVNLCGRDGAMTQHFLDITDIHVCLQQERGEGMAEHMRRDVHGNVCKFHVFVNHKADRLLRQAVAEAVDEQPSALGNLILKGFHVVGECGDNIWIADLQDAFFGAFAPDEQGMVFHVNILVF